MGKAAIKWIALIMIIAFSILPIMACDKTEAMLDEEGVVENLNSIDISDRFIEHLFAKNENVLNYSTGNVKKNIYNNMDSIKKSELIKVKSISEIESDDFSIVHSTVLYENDSGLNVVFYRLKLINTDEGYLVYKVDEAEPMFSEGESKDTGNKDMFNVINSYFKTIDENKLEDGIDFLIGKAKKNHMLTYKYLTNVKELSGINLSNIEYNKIFDNGELALVEVNYSINNKDANVIITLYKTHQGWLIYDVEQI